MAGLRISNRFRSNENPEPRAMVEPSRCEARKTNGLGESARPLGPSSAEGSNISAYGQPARSSQVRALSQCGTHAMRRKIVPKAPRRMLADFPGGKWIDSLATNENRSGYSRKCNLILYAFYRRDGFLGGSASRR